VNNQFDKEPSSAPEIRKGIKINKRVLIYGGLALVLILLLVNPDSKKENDTEKSASNKGDIKINVSAPPKFVGSSSSRNENEVVDLAKSELDEEIERLSSLDGSIADSEVHFRRGQRDFFNKNYHRAINSLELAISLNRSHPSASYYLQSAIHEAEQEASKNLEVGIKYFSALQYKRAIYHFKQVQSLLAHKKEDPVLKKCSEYIRLSEERLKAAELYP
jgi:tetratricopeptide (TPR) repeat protein